MRALRLVRGAAGKSILHHPAHNSLRQLLCFCHYLLHLHLPLPLSLGLLVFPPLEMNKVVLVTAGLTFDFGLDLYGGFYLPERPWPWAHHMITVASHGQVCDDTIVTWNRSTRWIGLLIKVSLFAYLRIFNFQEHGFIHETDPCTEVM